MPETNNEKEMRVKKEAEEKEIKERNAELKLVNKCLDKLKKQVDNAKYYSSKIKTKDENTNYLIKTINEIDYVINSEMFNVKKSIERKVYDNDKNDNFSNFALKNSNASLLKTYSNLMNIKKAMLEDIVNKTALLKKAQEQKSGQYKQSKI